MKKEYWLLSMNNIDDKYIEEAKPASVKIFRRKKKLIVLAACMAVMFALSLVLFIPYSAKIPEILKYSGNEYYEIIDRLNTFFYEPPKYKNNFEALVGGVTSLFRASMKNAGAEGSDGLDFAVDDMAPIPEASTGVFDTSTKGDGERYEEVTDNQVKGVIEGDLFKRSDKYIYYLDGNVLRVYSIAGLNSAEVGTYSLADIKDYNENSGRDMIYLSKDCKTVTVILNSYKYENGLKNDFSVISLDVSDPSKIVQKHIVGYEGEFISARAVEDKIYIISNFITKEPDNYKNAKAYVPSYTTEDGTELISADSIYCPDVLSSSGYTVLTKLDEKTLNVDADYALLSFYNPVIYTSKDSFYFVRNYNDREQNSDYTVYKDMCEICRIDYNGEGFKNMGSVVIEGEVNDQYSMDEHNGILRVFTSTDKSISWQTDLGHYGFSSDETGINASLFCIDKNTLKVVSSVEKFAPKGENVKSARFDGDTAYVCTAVKLTDPVYFFDLSNLNKITYKETGTVEGFSTSLVDFGEGYLLGIGQKDWSTHKIEIYKEEGDKVVSVTAIEMPDSNISTNYKAYYIDRENGYIGMGVTSYGYGYDRNIRYVIFKFENEKLDVAYEFKLEGDPSRMRGTYIDEYIYVLSQYNLKVISENELN